MSAACHIRPPIGDIKIPCLSSNVSYCEPRTECCCQWVSFPKINVLRPGRERPRCRAAEQRDELAPLHSITSSAGACRGLAPMGWQD
jgi:hypothetical protein